MQRTTLQQRSLGAAAALIVAGALAFAASGAKAKDSAKPANFAGAWQLDRKASDHPGMRGGGMGMHGGGMYGGGGGHHGGSGGGGGMGGPPSGGEMGGPPREGGERGPGGGGGRGRMASFLRVTQDASYVTIADTTGTTVREIALGDAAKGDDGNGVPVASGRWKGDKLEVVATDPNGRMRTETWSLSDDGKTLTIVAKMEAHDDRPAMEIKRVYHRTNA